MKNLKLNTLLEIRTKKLRDLEFIELKPIQALLLFLSQEPKGFSSYLKLHLAIFHVHDLVPYNFMVTPFMPYSSELENDIEQLRRLRLLEFRYRKYYSGRVCEIVVTNRGIEISNHLLNLVRKGSILLWSSLIVKGKDYVSRLRYMKRLLAELPMRKLVMSYIVKFLFRSNEVIFKHDLSNLKKLALYEALSVISADTSSDLYILIPSY
ncbi:MAG: hypothetical protein DRJ40_01160 [Thermoprotei archaeon]|nr:MAG: hypothetical protein DRJ40_01160 [Thermoprotei archaeon]